MTKTMRDVLEELEMDGRYAVDTGKGCLLKGGGYRESKIRKDTFEALLRHGLIVGSYRDNDYIRFVVNKKGTPLSAGELSTLPLGTKLWLRRKYFEGEVTYAKRHDHEFLMNGYYNTDFIPNECNAPEDHAVMREGTDLVLLYKLKA